MRMKKFLQRIQNKAAAIKPGRSFCKIIAKFPFLVRLVARFPLLIALYYYLKGSFYLEQKRVLLGTLKFREGSALDTADFPLYRVIRSTHALELGLSAKNRRSVFAEDYIESLTDDLERCVTTLNAKSDVSSEKATIHWTCDVIAKYFSLVSITPPIERAEKRFKEILKALAYIPGERLPYKRGGHQSLISYEALQELAIKRRSVRWFLEQTVPREIIDKAMRIASLSPSACNRQAFEFRVYDDPRLMKKICELPLGMGMYKDNVPCVIVIIGKQQGYESERDRHVIFIDASLAAMAFQFALETLGLASSCANWAAIPWREKKIEKLLNLADTEQIIMLMSVGYPDPEGFIPYSQKRSLDTLRSYNKA